MRPDTNHPAPRRRGSARAVAAGLAVAAIASAGAVAVALPGVGGAAPAAPAAAAPPPPPPPPAAKQWHLAENGATKGPFPESDLQAMASAGQLTRTTMVWSAGMDGWKPAADTELSRLFAMVPPPPPPGV